jgi:hypothetical protein
MQMQSEKLSCIYCDKVFNFKEVYDKHTPACEYFFQNRRQRHRDIECIEKLPSPQEMFQLVQHLTSQVKILTQDVDRLKKNSNYSIKKKTNEYLLKANTPTQLFDDWIVLFTVNNKHLEEIFKYTLTDGIKLCFSDRISNEGLQTIPIRAFKEKVGIIYVYTNLGDTTRQNSWEICSNEQLIRMIDLIGHEISKTFCNLEQTIDLEQQFERLIKVTGTKINKDRQKLDLKSWILSKIQVSLL